MTNGFARAVALGLILHGLCGFAGSCPAAEETLPAHWLALPERALVLNVHHEGIETNTPPRAGEFTQGVVRQLLQAGYTIRFSREMLERDFRRAQGAEDAWSQALAAVLHRGLEQGTLDWPALRELHVSAADTEQVSAWLPWLFLSGPTNRMLLAEQSNPGLAELRCRVAWFNMPVRGVAVRTGYGASITQGKGYVYKIDARLALMREGREIAAQHFPAPNWQSRYGTITPEMMTQRAVIQCLDKGLPDPAANPDAAPEEVGEKKVRRGFFFFRRNKD